MQGRGEELEGCAHGLRREGEVLWSLCRLLFAKRGFIVDEVTLGLRCRFALRWISSASCLILRYLDTLSTMSFRPYVLHS